MKLGQPGNALSPSGGATSDLCWVLNQHAFWMVWPDSALGLVSFYWQVVFALGWMALKLMLLEVDPNLVLIG